MESELMGKVIVTAKIENLNDVEMRERGLIPADQVRSVEVHDALVDTGATGLLVPKRLIAQLGLRHYRDRPARGLGGAITPADGCSRGLVDDSVGAENAPSTSARSTTNSRF